MSDMLSLKHALFFRGIAVTIFVLGMLVSEIPHSVAQGVGIFADLEDEAELPIDSSNDADDPKFLRTRYVRPNFGLLYETELSPGRGLIRLNLFDDADFSGVLDRIEENASGSTTFTGHLEGVPLGNFILVTRDLMMVGTVKMPGAYYRIGYLQDGIHAIYEMNEGAIPLELEPILSPSASHPGPQNSPAADDGSVIDVLVVYTEQAQANVGAEGFATMNDLIDLAVAETNTSYVDSGISQQLNLVHSDQITYSEIAFGWTQTITRLKGTSEGFMDEVHTIRDDHCADAVVLLVDNEDSCGIGYINSNAATAFSVVSTHCATGNYSFGHELGHNMGAYHDWYVDNTNTYAHGYVNYPDRWRTIMAYDTDCTDRGVNCTRLQYWSNPLLSQGGDPLGVPDGTSRACVEGVHDPICDADNHVKLNDTAITVANFRDTALCAPTYNINGYVRDESGTGINAISVDFGGAQTSVNTDSSGYYTQTGFEDGFYTVSLTKSGYSFSPFEDRVTISGSDAVHDATGYPFNPTGIPFNDDFESGSLGSAWAIETDYEGRVGVDTTYPGRGSYSLLLDDDADNTQYSHAAAILALDLTGGTQVDLSFWWREFEDEDHSGDGVFISDDQGGTWHSITPFTGTTNVYTHTVIDLDSAASSAGVSFNSSFLVKFQFYDNLPIDQDGYAIDDVWVSEPVGPLVYGGHTVNDNNINESRGDDDGNPECGEIIELFVDIANQGLTSAVGITTTLSTGDPYVTFLFNTASGYPDIPGGGSDDNNSDYDFALRPDIPDGHTVSFDLDITAVNGGPWTDSFELNVSCFNVYLPITLK
jgi:hypothetical protein